ncbi:hypothetical protein FS837_000543 [Tulasnella sp. UAMH 9824]|nr:hypothetical protein FS837_000543 [Tulasnella sp. UAMH 9824]
MDSPVLITNQNSLRENQARPEGVDVASHQGNVNWQSLDISFAYIKATEGIKYTNPYFISQYNGAYDAGLIRGAYHFARPNVSSGADQANHFIANGGEWIKDGRTLPGALDLEYNPYGVTNYGFSASEMVAWIHDFVDTYYAATTSYHTFWQYTSTGPGVGDHNKFNDGMAGLRRMATG